MENLNKECCVVTEQEDHCDSAATVNVYVNAKRHVGCGCSCGGGNDTGSRPDATNDHDQLINKNLGIQHDAAAIAFADGESIQQKYDNGELTGGKGETGEKGEAGVPGAKGERGASGVFVPDWNNSVDITQYVNSTSKTYTVPMSGFIYIKAAGGGYLYFRINANPFEFGLNSASGNAGNSLFVNVNGGDVITPSQVNIASGSVLFIPPVAALLPARTSDLATQPQNWTAGTEINFADGSYGQRFTGTITALADEFVNTELMEAAATIISCGGTVAVDANTPPTKGSVPYSGAVTSDGSVSLEANINNGQTKVSLFSKCSAARTDAEYDVWIRYTK